MADTAVQTVAPRNLAVHLLANGQSHISVAQAQAILGLSPQSATAALTKLRKAGDFFSPHPGLYFPVPPQYRSWGVLPATDFIDAYMRALDRRYYVGLLSAAELWGAAHQRPQTFDVIVNKPIANKDFGRVKLRFHTAARAERVATVQRASAAESFVLSSPAVTLLDIADRPRECGGINNAATVAHELVDEQRTTGADLAAAAADFPSSAARRLGWLLTHTAAGLDLRPLNDFCQQHKAKRSTTYLDPTGIRAGRADRAWQIVVNTEVEADL